jgi:hypothetical protein
MPGGMIARLITVAAVVGLCGLAALRGWSIVAFATAGQPGGGTEGAGVRAWIGAPLVTAAALDATLDDLAGASDIEAASRRIDLLTQLLSVRPLSSVAWLSLAGMRLVTGAPYKDVLATLRMSSITGPNEARLMWQRGMFGLLQWETLPPDFRQQTILDLSGPIFGQLLDDSNLQQMKGILGAKTSETQVQIAGLLETQGVTSAELTKIGLAPTAGKP